jgi:dTDP-4-amino-4,6-dideoxygalactose transaminase
LSRTLDMISPFIRRHFQLNKTEFVPGKTRIPLTIPTYDHEEVEEAVDSLLSTWVTMGAKVKKFEEAFAQYNGSRHAVMVNSGSSANLLALSVLTNPIIPDHIEKGSEIITPAVTWATTVYPISNVGCTPVLVDVDPRSFNIIPEQIEKAIGPKTKAIVPVHLLGRPSEIDQISKIAEDNDLFLVEDSCESTGAEFRGMKVGSFGDMGTFSFFISHHISTIEGGIIVTDNDKLYEYLKAMRAFGWVRDLQDKDKLAKANAGIDPRFLFITHGYNLRPTEIQGAFGMHQIRKLDNFIEQRRNNAAYWTSKLSPYSDLLILPEEQPGTKHVYFGYHLTVSPEAPFSREKLVDHLESRLIETRPVMAGNMAEQPVMKQLSHRISGSLPHSRMIMRQSFFFGNHTGIGDHEREYIADSITEFLDASSRR